MSGIAVQFHRDGRPVDPRDVWAMLFAVPYRGLDGMLVHSLGNLALGYAKLTITPEEVDEQQPLISQQSGCAIVADIRLDNREDLFGRIPGQLESKTTDAELVLRGYEEWGIDVFPQLLGDFAVVIWDPMQQQLVCARDTSGQRPLYYRINDRTFAAATEIHQLFQDPAIPVEPNHQRVREHLTPLVFNRNEREQYETYYEGIFSVLAGHLLVVNAAGHQHRPYWTFQPPAEIRYRNDDQYAEHFRELFFEVVRSKLRSVHPVGSTLSGGLDSSSVVCVAQQLYRTGRASNPGFTSFSITYEGLECDERDFIEETQRMYGFDARYIPYPQSMDRLQLSSSAFRATPNSELAEINAVYSAASGAGTRTLLTGDVADACIGGTQLTFDSLLRHGQFRTFKRHFQAYRDVSDESWLKMLALYFLNPALPLRLQRTLLLAHEQRILRRDEQRLLPKWMPAEFREDLLRRNRLRLAEHVQNRTFSNSSKQFESSLLYPVELAQTPPGFAMQTVRPYADRRLHEFLLAIPPEQKYSPHPDADSFYAGSKYLLRRSLAGVLPERIRTRTSKAVFNSVFAQEVAREWGIYSAAFSPEHESQAAAHGYIDPEAFWSRLNEVRAGTQKNDFMYLRGIVELETWLRGFGFPRDQRITLPYRDDVFITEPATMVTQSDKHPLHMIPGERVAGPHPGA